MGFGLGFGFGFGFGEGEGEVRVRLRPDDDGDLVAPLAAHPLLELVGVRVGLRSRVRGSG